MPGGDGTGPMGLGPMTGRGAGYCAGYASPDLASQRVGFCGGIGGGRGFRRMYYLTGLPRWARSGNTAASPSAQAVDEKNVLTNQQDFLERQLQQVKERLKEIDEQK